MLQTKYLMNYWFRYRGTEFLNAEHYEYLIVLHLGFLLVSVHFEYRNDVAIMINKQDNFRGLGI